MAVTRKPARAVADEANVQKLINRGGSVAMSIAPGDPQKLQSILLRLPSEMVAQIDEAVKRRRPVRISRIAWIIEALNDRLIAEQKYIE